MFATLERQFPPQLREIGFAPLRAGRVISALSARVCGKLFMRLIKMNVFICLLSTKKRSAPAKSGDV